MSVSVSIPARFVEEARKRGLDIEDLVLEAVARALEIDPGEVARARLEIAERSLREAEDYIARGDAVQASEKIYRVVEECIKALAERLGTRQLEEVRRRGRWDTWLLGMAATELSERLGEERVSLAWAKAYEIHVWGFHEARYGIEHVRPALPLVRWLVEYVKKVVEG